MQRANFGHFGASAGFTATAVSPSLIFSCDGQACPAPLPAAFRRLTSKMWFADAPAHSSGNVINFVDIVLEAETDLAYGVNESYTLSVPTSGTVMVRNSGFCMRSSSVALPVLCGTGGYIHIHR